jgi:hypothetical protein
MPASLAASLALMQSQLPEIAKTQTANVKTDKANYSYSYADLANVTRVVVPLLGRCGLAWMTKPTFNADGKFVLAYALLHVGGEREVGEYPLPTTGTPQAIGSAITYARRYTLCSVTGVAPDQDDDDAAAAQAASLPGPRTVKRRERPPGSPAAPAGPSTTVRRPPPSEGPPLPGEAPASDLIDPRGAQMKRLHATLRDSFATRDEGYAFVSTIVGRDVASTSELTVREASAVIDACARKDDAAPSEGEWDAMSGDEAAGEERADA